MLRYFEIFCRQEVQTTVRQQVTGTREWSQFPTRKFQNEVRCKFKGRHQFGIGCRTFGSAIVSTAAAAAASEARTDGAAKPRGGAGGLSRTVRRAQRRTSSVELMQQAQGGAGRHRAAMNVSLRTARAGVGGATRLSAYAKLLCLGCGYDYGVGAKSKGERIWTWSEMPF
eukprot:SAG31_NODE_4838_length_2913_cov_2.769367_5_plen_170_part_00